MSYQEKRALVLIGSQISLMAGYWWFVQSAYGDLAANADVFHFWARAILIMVPVFMLGHILALTLFAFINKAVSGEDYPKVTDERDKLIELKALRGEYFLTILAVFAAMLTSFQGASMTATFIVLILGLQFGSIASNLTRYFLHRNHR